MSPRRRVIVCHCLNVTASDIHDAVRAGDAADIRDVSTCTGAGTGCTACRTRIRRMIADYQAQASPASICLAK